MSEQNRNMDGRVIPFYAVRLADLITPKARLRVCCGFCAHEGEIDVIALAARHGPTTQLRTLQRRLRCRQCDMGGWATFSLTWLHA